MLVDRIRFLLLGSPGAGKSQAIIDLALALPQITVHAFDMQDSIAPLLTTRARFDEPVPENLDLHRIGGSPPDAWDQFKEECDFVFANAGYGDWLCFDVAQDWWQLAQDAYVEKTYGVAMAQFKEMKVQEARKTERKSKKILGFGGLDNDDWSVIKPKYQSTIPRALSTRCITNVLVTANEKVPAHYMKGDEMIFLEANLPGQYKTSLVKPHGESQLTSQVDVVLWLKHPTDRKWTLSTIGKNRFRLELKDEDITGNTMWEVYCLATGRDSSRSPGEGE